MEFSIIKKIKDRQNEAEGKLKEIQDKKAEFQKQKEELEQKQKELEEFERKGAEEIADARKDVDAKIEQLVVEGKKRFERDEEIHQRLLQSERLEELLEKEEERPKAPVAYGDALQNVINQSPTFYDITNYNVTNRLEGLAREAEKRALTKEEKDFVDIVSYHATNLARDDYYKDKQGATYLKKQLAQVDFINKLARNEQERNYNV